MIHSTKLIALGTGKKWDACQRRGVVKIGEGPLIQTHDLTGRQMGVQHERPRVLGAQPSVNGADSVGPGVGIENENEPNRA